MPVARLAAAKAAVELGTSPKGGKGPKAKSPKKSGKPAKGAKKGGKRK